MSAGKKVAPRGLSLLHAMEPTAREQVNTLANIVLQSQLKNNAANILCDGGFGWDPDYLEYLVDTFSQENRIPHFLFYLTNGPGSRHWQSHLYPGIFGQDISPEDFREKIMTDKAFQQDFQKLYIRLNPVIAKINQNGGVARVVPQLEDNQTDESFQVMVELIQEVMPADLRVELGRNPCIGCYPGNQGTIPKGLFAEYHLHSASTSFKFRDGVATNDGCTYTFPGEKPVFSTHLPLTDFNKVQAKADQQNDWFLLWSAKYQGLSKDTVPPSQRLYVAPTREEQQELLAFLKLTDSGTLEI